MSRKKNRGPGAQQMMDLPIRNKQVQKEGQGQVQEENESQKQRQQFYVQRWDEYMGDNTLADFQRLCNDLGLPGDDFPSKSQCRKALKGVHVNIWDFLDAVNKPHDVRFFESERKLARYTMKHDKTFPRNEISKGSPLRQLLARILYPRAGKNSKQ